MGADHWDVPGPFLERLLPGQGDQRGSNDEFEEEAHLLNENGAAGMPSTWTAKPARQRVSFWEKVNQWRIEDGEWLGVGRTPPA